MEFEHQLYRSDLNTSKFAFKSYLKDASKFALEKDTISMEVSFDKFRQSLMDEDGFTNHDKIRIILENYLDLVTQIQTKYPDYYNKKNILVPYCTGGLYQTLTPKKILIEMSIRKSLIENGLILAAQNVESSQYASLLGRLPKSSKEEIIKTLKSIDIIINENELMAIAEIVNKIEDPVVDKETISEIKATAAIDASNNLTLSNKLTQEQFQQQQQNFGNKIFQI